jgi:transposase InsO family protein
MKQHGYAINHKTVLKLMRAMCLKSVVRTKKYKSYRDNVGIIAPNLINRQFEADQPNTKWVTDVTEFNISGQKIYLSPILVLFNREVVSYTVDKRPHAQMVPQMLMEASKRLKK